MKRRFLVLSDGTVFEGRAFGADTDAVGELVFTTGMNGYIETLTDPSYFGQIVLQTYPLIGNYGMIPADFEGKCHVRGYVVREYCTAPSNFRCEGDLDTFLKEQGVPGICGIDTRAVTRRIREEGVMNALLCSSVPDRLESIREYTIADAVPSVTVPAPETAAAVGEPVYRVALLDYGAKRNIVRELNRRGCEVQILPASASAEDVLSLDPDGIMLSNGPGDPADAVFQIDQIQKLLGKKPLFGICLGHQLTALAAGAKTSKLKYGHRGGNQPCRDVLGTRTFITSQNHGYAVESDTVKTGVVRYINANDKTCEGIDYPDLQAFTVQFHPEACSGPHDTSFLFDRFVDLMGGADHAAE